MDVVFTLPAPVFTTPDDSPMYISENEGGSVSVTWVMLNRYDSDTLTGACNITGECNASTDLETMSEIDWYSLTSEIDGVVREIYNGSEATTVIHLEPGQHRLRVKAYSGLNGAESEYSDSTFVIVEESSSNFPLTLGAIVTLMILVIGGFSFSKKSLRIGSEMMEKGV